MQTLIMGVSERLATKWQREHVKDYLSRAKPGVRHTFMQNGSLREGVKIRRSKDNRRIKVQIKRRRHGR